MEYEENKGAIISTCGHYRYSLWRKWGYDERNLHIIMLNPSTADANEDDPTIRRCIGFAKDNGHSGIFISNLFALRTSDPKVLYRHPHPVSDPHRANKNDVHIRLNDMECCRTIFAWGAHGSHKHRDIQIIDRFPGAGCLGFTLAGHPKHPLYLPKNSPIVAYKPLKTA